MKKLLLFLGILLFSTFNLFANDASSDLQNLPITFTTHTYFNQLYPMDEKEFTFFQGEKTLTMNEFITLSKDPVLLKTQDILKKTRYNGFFAAAVLGGITTSFLIPSIVFIALQTNYYLQQSNYQALGYNSWVEYFGGKYPEIFFPGLITIAFTVVSAAALIVELIITLSVIAYYSFNEKLIKEAVDRYNNKFKKRSGLSPVFYNDDQSITAGFTWKF